MPSQPATSSAVPAMKPKRNQVLFRMYGQGFGDCFLLAFQREVATETVPASDPRPVYVLFDCGAIAGTPDEDERMTAIVQDIHDTTSGHLDLLVITHEHRDHLSGFAIADAIWKEIDVDALWLGWLESDDPDGLPGWLKKLIKKQTRALALAADQARRFGLADRQETLLGLMSFLVDAPADGQGFAAAVGTGAAFDVAKGLVPKQRHTFCEPGDVRCLPGTKAQCYVLGPPRNEKRLRQRMKKAEIYGDDHAATAFDATIAVRGMVEGRSLFNAFAMPLMGPSLLAAAEGTTTAADATEHDIYDRSFPFDRSLRVPIDEAERAVSEHPEGYPVLASYGSEINHWRRIDTDWLGAANSIALEVDELINNTSLVLAIELPPAKTNAEQKILLMVGDAQVGNWLSWDDITEWRAFGDAQATQAAPDIGNLLARTALYKVGHHGSHNATLKAKGVERMRSDGGLTAFVPVSHPVACEIKNWCEIPKPSMLDALSARSEGRVVLPNGKLWPKSPNGPAGDITAIGGAVSKQKLPIKNAKNDAGHDERIEDTVPLWVQIGIGY